MGKCPLCKQEAQELAGGYPQRSYNCPTCGDFTLSESAQMRLIPWLPDTPLPHLSAFAREQTLRRQEPGNSLQDRLLLSDPKQGVPLPGATPLEDAEATFPKTVPARLDCFMLNLARIQPMPGQPIFLTERDYSVAYAEDITVANFFAEQLQEMGWIKCEPAHVGLFGIADVKAVITVKGWTRISEIQQAELKDKTAATPAASIQQSIHQNFYGNVGNLATGSQNFKQETVFNQQDLSIDLFQLKDELLVLQQVLVKEARRPERDAAIVVVQEAVVEAENGDTPKLQQSLAKLSKVGPWILDVVTKIGTSVLVDAIKKSAGV